MGMGIDKVEIQRNEYINPEGGVREVEQITLWIAGYRFSCDVKDTDRDHLMAMRIAEEAGCLFHNMVNQK